MTLSQQQRLTKYLNEVDLGIPRQINWGSVLIPEHIHPRLQVEQLTSAFANDAEFYALNLGTFLSTPNGQMVTAAIEAVIPPFYAEDIDVIARALIAAAQAQTNEIRTRALKVAGVASIVLIGAVWFGRSAA